MRDRPTGEELLATARSVLRDDLLPALPADKRHSALMIANALAIAGRQLGNGDAVERAELAALEQLLSEPCAAEADNPAALRATLVAANHKLARSIRSGLADRGAFRDSVHRHLVSVAHRKVTESNPRYLGIKA